MRRIQREMERLGAAIGKLEDEACAAGEEVKAEIGKLKPELDRKLAEAQGKLAAVKSHSGEAWQEAKQGAKKALQDVREAYERAAAKFKGNPPAQAPRQGGGCGPSS